MPGALSFLSFFFLMTLIFIVSLKLLNNAIPPPPPPPPLAWFLFLSVTLFILYLFILLEYSCFTMLR